MHMKPLHVSEQQHCLAPPKINVKVKALYKPQGAVMENSSAAGVWLGKGKSGPRMAGLFQVPLSPCCWSAMLRLRQEEAGCPTAHRATNRASPVCLPRLHSSHPSLCCVN